MQFGNSAGISFSGLSSGIDTDSIVRQLVALETQSTQRLQLQQQRLKTQKEAYSQFQTQLTSLNTASSSFGLSTAFQSTKGASSTATVATITANAGASPAITELTVYKLAQAEKIASRELPNTGAAMNISGKFKINDKEITLDGTETLSAISKKINDSGAGATSSVISTGNGKSYLSLTSTTTGIAGKLTMSNLESGNALEDLGLRESLVNTANGTASSLGQTSATTSIKTLLGMPDGAFSFSLNGNNITGDASMSLNDLAASINSAGVMLAAVVPVVNGSTTTYRLDISTLDNKPIQSFEDPNGFLSKSGFIKGSTTLVQAQDSEFALDGVRMTRSSNSITDALEGATINLLEAAADGTKKTNLSIDKDSTKAVETVKSFMNSYNRIVDFVRANSKFDATTFQSGVLFSDSVSQNVENTLNTQLFNNIDSVSGPYTNLAQLGFTLSAEGKLELDETVFKAAVLANPDAVANVFRANGTTSDSEVSFVSAGNKVKASGFSGYDVQITKAASKTSVTAQTTGGVNAGGETLTFAGNIFGSTGYQLSISAGRTVEEIASTINSDSKLKSQIEATVEGGKLIMKSKTFGASSSFSVTSNVAGSNTSSGVGTGGVQVRVLGEDVAGTINGEPATGYGRFLTGASGNSRTEALQIEYKGTTTGSKGKLTVSMGLGGAMSSAVDTFNNSTSGVLVSNNTSLESQIKALDDQIARITERGATKQAELKRRFAQMEQAIAQANAQGQRAQASLNSGSSR